MLIPILTLPILWLRITLSPQSRGYGTRCSALDVTDGRAPVFLGRSAHRVSRTTDADTSRSTHLNIRDPSAEDASPQARGDVAKAGAAGASNPILFTSASNRGSPRSESTTG